MERILCSDFIQFEPLQATKSFFYQKYNFPGVVGCVDGTHIYLLKPTVNEHSYLNRKSRHSLNVMIICDENMTITALDANYWGSNHDSFIWSNSREKLYMEHYLRNNPNSWLLGDSGYPLEPCLMTPYRPSADNSPEANYNKVHSKARSIIERCIGLWKGRWRILLSERQCRYTPEKLVQICNVCAALHNICLKFNVSWQDIQVNVEDNKIMPTIDVSTTVSNRRLRALADAKRNNIRDDLLNLNN